jgi:hypothetical protein
MKQTERSGPVSPKPLSQRRTLEPELARAERAMDQR